MTAQAQDTTVRTEIVVEAPIDRAFRVFTHNMLSVDIAESVLLADRDGPRQDERG